MLSLCGSACICKCNVLTNVIAELSRQCSDTNHLPFYLCNSLFTATGFDVVNFELL